MAVDHESHTRIPQQPSQPPPPTGDSPYASYAYPPEDEITLSEIWAALYARKYMIASVSLLTAVLAAASSYLIRPTFRAEVLVSPVTEQRNPLAGLAAQFGSLAELAGVNLTGGGSSSAAIATLKSRVLTEAFIKDFNLLPVLFEKDWDADNGRWKDDDPRTVPTLWDAYRDFDTSIRQVVEDRRSGLVTVAVEWHDAESAADWANELVRRANVKLQQDTINESQKTIAYLEQQLASEPAIEVRQALYSLIEVETKNTAVAHARQEFAFKVIDPAVGPHEKTNPKRALITMMGLSVGFVVCALFALLASVRTRSGVARTTK